MVVKVRIQMLPVKHLKRSGGVGAAAPPMMIAKVMIQLGPKNK